MRANGRRSCARTRWVVVGGAGGDVAGNLGRRIVRRPVRGSSSVTFTGLALTTSMPACLDRLRWRHGRVRSCSRRRRRSRYSPTTTRSSAMASASWRCSPFQSCSSGACGSTRPVARRVPRGASRSPASVSEASFPPARVVRDRRRATRPASSREAIFSGRAHRLWRHALRASARSATVDGPALCRRTITSPCDIESGCPIDSARRRFDEGSITSRTSLARGLAAPTAILVFPSRHAWPCLEAWVEASPIERVTRQV